MSIVKEVADLKGTKNALETQVLLLQKQNADLVAALKSIELLAKSPFHRTPRTQVQMCSFFDDIVLPLVEPIIDQIEEE